MRSPWIKRFVAALAALAPPVLIWSGPAFAQVQVTPNVSVTPSTSTTPWIVQMALAAGVLALLIILGLAAGYLRFAPKFYGREEAAKPQPPGYRPPLLARGTGASGRSPAASTRPPVAATPAGSTAAASVPRPAPAAAPSTATATAERPARAPSEAEQIASPASEGEAAAVAASTSPTAGPQGEPAVQADAVGEAEAAAPEPRPTAKTPEEMGEPAEASTAPVGAAAPAARAEHTAGGAMMDQETFDRVLTEQLDKGVDRRVAEGRARAAAVVAARKKAQG